MVVVRMTGDIAGVYSFLTTGILPAMSRPQESEQVLGSVLIGCQISKFQSILYQTSGNQSR